MLEMRKRDETLLLSGPSFSDPHPDDTPARLLMRAILDDALHDLEIRPGRYPLLNRRRAIETFAWVQDTDATYLYSFESICHHLNIEVGSFRRYLLRDYERRFYAQPATPPGREDESLQRLAAA